MKKIILLVLAFASIEGFAQERTAINAVEHMPMFNGRDTTAFKKYVKQNLTYPATAAKKGAFGRVNVSFTIESNGVVGNTKIEKGVHPALDSAAARVIRNSPMWIPGFQSGKPVAVSYSVSINFMLGLGKELPAEKNDICILGSMESVADSIPAAIQKETIDIFSAFYAWTSKLQQVTCDGFDGLLYKSKIKVKVDSYTELVYAVYNNNQSIMTTNTYDGKKTVRIFCNTPEDQKFILIGIKVVDGAVYFSCQEKAPSKDLLTLDYKQVDLQELKKELEMLGK